MTITIVPIVVSVVGVLLYSLSANGKVQEIGRIAFFCGLLALCLGFAGQTVRMG